VIAAEDDDAAEQIKTAVVETHVKRSLRSELERVLYKERVGICAIAKRTGNFVVEVDKFYAMQSSKMMESISEHADTLHAIGINFDCATVCTEWVRDGKDCVLNVAGDSTPSQLSASLHRLFESKTWSDRPKRAVEGVDHAALGV